MPPNVFTPSRFVAGWPACIRHPRHLVPDLSYRFFHWPLSNCSYPGCIRQGPLRLLWLVRFVFVFFCQCQFPASQILGCVPLLRLFLLCYCFCMVRLRSALATPYRRALATSIFMSHLSDRSLPRTSHNGPPLRHRALATLVFLQLPNISHSMFYTFFCRHFYACSFFFFLLQAPPSVYCWSYMLAPLLLLDCTFLL